MFHIACCDDDPVWMQRFAQDTGQILNSIGVPFILTTFHSGAGLLSALSESPPPAVDLLFLDIILGEENGLDVARQLRTRAPDLPIILVSTSSEFAVEGYNVHPLHYLVKPIPRERLQEALLYALQKAVPAAPLVVRGPDATQVVPLHQILYIEVFDHQLKIHTLQGHILTAAGSLSQLQQELPAGQFFRCHKSYLVNLAQIEGIRRYQILLPGRRTIPVSKQNYPQVYQAAVRYTASVASLTHHTQVSVIKHEKELSP